MPQNRKEYTGLVIDARGLGINPAMTFQLVDEDGKEVYGSAYVSREHVVQWGMCEYTSDINAIKKNERIGGNSIVVKGIKVKPPGNSDVIISGADASRVRGAVEHLGFLKECRVMIVMDKLFETIEDKDQKTYP